MTTAPDITDMLCYSPRQLSQFAHVVPQAIYRVLKLDEDKPAKQKKFPNAFRMGDKIMIPEQDAIAYLGFDPKRTRVHTPSSLRSNSATPHRSRR